jgi:hypothetical protein
MFGIWIEITGGVEPRAGWMHQAGTIIEYASYAEAEVEAVRLARKMADSPYSKATFCYSVKERPGAVISRPGSSLNTGPRR